MIYVKWRQNLFIEKIAVKTCGDDIQAKLDSSEAYIIMWEQWMFQLAAHWSKAPVSKSATCPECIKSLFYLLFDVFAVKLMLQTSK